MPRVLVTGGSGKLGRATVRELIDNGWEVVNLDQAPPKDPICPFVKVDFTDFGQTYDALTGSDEIYARPDAVVHLAAIPRPGLIPNAATFHNNMMSSYNVFAAARNLGINNIVWASSESVLGLPFNDPPPYIPLDEEYLPRPETTYSLGKFLEEQMASQLSRRSPELKIFGLRLSHVHDPEDYGPFPGFDDDPSLRKFNLWSYIDSRDAAQAVRKALEHPGPGYEVFIITNADTVMSTPNDELVAEHFPGVPYSPTPGPNDTLLSIEKARRILGFQPQHTWRTQTQR